MAETYKFALVGVGDNVQLGKRGPRIKVFPSGIQFKNFADTGLVKVQVANAVGADEAVTLGQLNNAIGTLVAALVYRGIFDASAGSYAALSGAKQGDLYKISVAGTIGAVDWQVGDILIVNKDVVGAPTAADVDKIDNTEAPDILRTGDISTDADFSVDGTKLTTRAAIKTFVESRVGAGDRLADVVFDSAATVNVGPVVPAGSIVKRAYIHVSQVFDGATESTLEIGSSGDTDSVAESKHIDLHRLGEYEVACHVKLASATQLIATYARDGATQGAAEIVLELVSA